MQVNYFNFDHLDTIDDIVKYINESSVVIGTPEFLSASYCHDGEKPEDVTEEIIDLHLSVLRDNGAVFDYDVAKILAKNNKAVIHEFALRQLRMLIQRAEILRDIERRNKKTPLEGHEKALTLFRESLVKAMDEAIERYK